MLKEKIKSRKAKIGIIGLGYVGLPLAVEFAKAGFSVLGIEQSPSRKEARDSPQPTPRTPPLTIR